MVEPTRMDLARPCSAGAWLGAKSERTRIRLVRGLRRLLLAFLLLAALGPGAGKMSRVHAMDLKVEAPSFRFDQKQNSFEYDDARLTLGDLTLFASKVTVWPEQGRVLAVGGVRFINLTVYGDAERLEFSMKDRGGTMEQATLFDTSTGFRLEARQLVLEPDGGFTAKGCSLTNCPADVVGWNLYTSSLSHSNGNTALALNSTLRLGVVPILWMPIFAWPTSRERQNGFLVPRLTQQISTLPRLDLGWRLSVPYFIALGDEQNLTLEPEWIEKRGAALKLDYEYAFLPGQKGEVAVWGLRERFERRPADENDILAPGEAALREPRPLRRTLEWRHSQRLEENGRVTWNYEHGGDGQALREYSQRAEERPYHVWQVGATGQWDLGDFSLAGERRAEYTDESLYADSGRYTDRKKAILLAPRLGWRLGGRPLEILPVGLELGLEGVRFQRLSGLGGQLLLAEPGVMLPISLARGMELRMAGRRRMARYQNLWDSSAAPGMEAVAPEAISQDSAEVGLHWNFGRTYPQSAGGWNAIHHRITPRVVYATVKDARQPLAGQVLSPRPAMSLLTFHLDNSVLGRQGEPDSPGQAMPAVEVARVNLLQRYNLMLRGDAPILVGPQPDSGGETEPGQPLLPLRLEGKWNASSFDTQLMVDYHHQRKGVTRLEYGLNVRLGSRTNAGLGYRFNAFKHTTPEGLLVLRQNNMALDTRVALGDRFTLGMYGLLNLKDDPPPLNRTLTQAQAFLDYHPSCYTFRIGYREEVSSTAEGVNTRYYVERKIMLRFEIPSLTTGQQGLPRLLQH